MRLRNVKIIYMLNIKKWKNKRYVIIQRNVFSEERVARKEGPIKVLDDIFKVAPTHKEFVERTSMITRKRKRAEKLEADPKPRKYKVQYVANSLVRGRGEY